MVKMKAGTLAFNLNTRSIDIRGSKEAENVNFFPLNLPHYLGDRMNKISKMLALEKGIRALPSVGLVSPREN